MATLLETLVGGGPPKAVSPPEAGEDRQVAQAACSRGTRWLWLSAIVCPCHFPLIVFLALGGTALGAAVRSHLVWLFAGSAALFVAFLLAGLRVGATAADPPGASRDRPFSRRRCPDGGGHR